VVVCCRRRDDEPAEGKAYKDKDNDSIELEHYDSVYSTISGAEALKTSNDYYKAEDKYYTKIGDDNEYCSPGVVQSEEFKPYSALGLPELPERLPKPAEESPEPTAGDTDGTDTGTAGDTADTGETEPTDDSSPYYITLVGEPEPSVC